MAASNFPISQVAGEIRAELARSNITHAEFAKRLGIKPSGFSRRMNGEIRWTAEELQKVATELGIELSQLLDGARR